MVEGVGGFAQRPTRRILYLVVLAPKRNRPPVPEPDPVRDTLAAYLEEPTAGTVHEILGAFLLREQAWRILHRCFLGGAALAAICGAIYLLAPEGLLDIDRYMLAKTILLASPFLVGAFWLRLRRRRLLKSREGYAEAVADAISRVTDRLGHMPAVDRRLRAEALRRSRTYPRLHEEIGRVGIDSGIPRTWRYRKTGWRRTPDDSLK